MKCLKFVVYNTDTIVGLRYMTRVKIHFRRLNSSTFSMPAVTLLD